MAAVDAAVCLMSHGFDRCMSKCMSKFRTKSRQHTVVSVVDAAVHRKYRASVVDTSLCHRQQDSGDKM